MVITPNRAVHDCGTSLADATTTILDRLMYRCTMLEKSREASTSKRPQRSWPSAQSRHHPAVFLEGSLGWVAVGAVPHNTRKNGCR